MSMMVDGCCRKRRKSITVERKSDVATAFVTAIVGGEEGVVAKEV